MIAGTPWLVAVVIFCHGHGAIAQARYLVGMDGTLSASMGAENLIAIHRAVYALQDRALKPKLFDETTKARKSAGILYRLGKTALLDNVIDHLPALVQHEVFGHGARFREFGLQGDLLSLQPVPALRQRDRTVQLARANDGRRETDLPGRRSMDIIRTRGRRHRWPPV